VVSLCRHPEKHPWLQFLAADHSFTLSENLRRLGLRWQAQRDTAFVRTESSRRQFSSRPLESAVAAPAFALLRRGKPALPTHSMTLYVSSQSLEKLNLACLTKPLRVTDPRPTQNHVRAGA
jgi:hypothetical protein